MKENKFLIIGGDKRQKYLNDLMLKKGYNTRIILNEQTEKTFELLNIIPEYNVIILPVPLSGDGVNIFAPNIKDKIELAAINEKISKNSVLFLGGENSAFNNCKAKRKINFMQIEEMTLKNAMATAEAALSILIKETENTIYNSNAVILGYGRIAKILAEYLSFMNSKITVFARNSEARVSAELKGYSSLGFDKLEENLFKANIIVNTVPSLILGKKELMNVSSEAFILDLASKPGGIDYETAKIFGIKTLHALSLPGKYSAKSAAEYILSGVEKNI